MDGSGKTTLARAVGDELAARGRPVEYVYGRFQPVLTRPLLGLARRVLLRGSDRSRAYGAYADRRRRLFANPLLYAAYQTMLAVDYLAQVTWRIRRSLLLGHDLICDRYYIDTSVADIAFDTENPERTLRWLIPLYRSLLPPPDAIVMIDVPAAVANERKNDIPSQDYAEQLRELYLYAAGLTGTPIIDGTKPVAQVAAQALRYLDPLLTGRSGVAHV